jgi:hypothetical protein
MLWYYTPMALDASRHLTSSRAVVYDCMDELSAFRGAPPDLIFATGVGRAGRQLRERLLGHADEHRSAVPPGDERLEQEAARFQVLRDGAVSDGGL